MLGQITSVALVGLEAHAVRVETHVAAAMPAFVIVGLPDTAVQESRERVRAAIVNAGYEFPSRRVIVNLAPADVRKSGPRLDLPIALSFLAATGQLDGRAGDLAAVGELGLDGSVRSVTGGLALAEGVRRAGLRGLLVPAETAAEAALVPDVDVFPVSSLREAAAVATGGERRRAAPVDVAARLANVPSYDVDLEDVVGQHVARRALEIAAAGGHNVLMVGPPGSGKTMLARRLPTILPPLTVDEALSVTRIHGVAGSLGSDGPLVCRRPFRAPHHTVSTAGLVGGGAVPRPGEVSLAHLGVLFLDELAEFRTAVLEALRQPLEDGSVTVTRALTALTFPARVMLVGAMNPCPCGFLGDDDRECTCTLQRLRSYRARISGPFMDRIDLRIAVGRVNGEDLRGHRAGEPSDRVRERVCRARRLQVARLRDSPAGDNAGMSAREVRRRCRLDPAAAAVLDAAYAQLRLSARSCERVVKVAQTIADLDGVRTVADRHVRESLTYRGLDRDHAGGLGAA